MDMNMDMSMEELNVVSLIEHPQAMIVPALLFLGYLLKTSVVPDKWIVWILAAVGMLLGYVFVAHNAQGIVAGFLYASSTVTGHQAYKQLMKKE